MDSNINENIIEKLHNSGFIFLVFGSMISADNLTNVSSCEIALNQMKLFDEALKTANIDEESKIEYQKFINNGFNIINSDLEKFKEKMETDG